MKAVIHDRYGPAEVLRLEDVERPVPKDNQVLVRVHATSVTRADCAMREASARSGLFAAVLNRLITGIRRPRQRILGTDFAGVVEATGQAVSEFAAGDRVFGSTGFGFGANAEYVVVKTRGLIASMPAGKTFEEVAPVCDGGLNALWALRQGRLRKGERILVYGASGAIGTAGVQLANAFGAEVTAVCDTTHLDAVSSLGPRNLIDYTLQDFTQSGETYDVIFDAVGKLTFARCKGSLTHGGRFLATDDFTNLVLARWTSLIGGRKVVFSIPPRYKQQDVVLFKKLIDTGRYRAVIDRTYPLEDVIEATRYVETEQKTGNVVLTVAGD